MNGGDRDKIGQAFPRIALYAAGEHESYFTHTITALLFIGTKIGRSGITGRAIELIIP